MPVVCYRTRSRTHAPKSRRVAVVAAAAVAVSAQPDARTAMLQGIDARRESYAGVAKQIWAFAEVGYQEQKSSALLQQQLRAAGFQVTAGVADIPTAFVATFGSGKPVIGIVGEFDALPGLSQEAQTAMRHAIEDNAPGHGCGHNLLGTGALAAAVAVKEWLASSGTPARSATTARRPKKAARARSTWCAPGCSRTSTPSCRGIRAIATRPARRAPRRTSPASSASAASRRTPRPRPTAGARRSTPSKRWTTWST